jgi:hypothetical protein
MFHGEYDMIEITYLNILICATLAGAGFYIGSGLTKVCLAVPLALFCAAFNLHPINATDIAQEQNEILKHIASSLEDMQEKN